MKASECEITFGYHFTGDPNAEVCDHVVELMRKNPPMEQRSEEWYEMRKKVVSASDIASAIGDNPHKLPKSLLRDKVFGATFEGNIYTAHGQKYEPIACQKFCDQTGHTVFEFGLLPHPVIGFIGGSPDGICADGSIIEIKCPMAREIKDEVPGYYYPQVQTVLEIVDCPTNKAYFIQYKPDGINGTPERFSIVEVARSREWFAEKLPIIDSFWKSVVYYREHPNELEPCMVDLELYS
jgi:putative phage-type endonuclease